MLNPHNQNEALGARMVELLLKAKFSGVFSDEELKDMAYGMGISIEWQRTFLNEPQRETTLARLQRMLYEAECEALSNGAELERVKRIGHY